MTIPYFPLKNNEKMPVFGLGTWQLTGSQCEQAVKMALEMGYPLIDTSDDYGNEEEIGHALKGYDRSQVFITSKVDDSMLHKGDVRAACHDSIRRLGVGYLDLYLIHRPNPSIPLSETLAALKSLVEDNLVRSIGISNYSIQGTQAVLEAAEIPVCVSQIKINPYHFPEGDIRFLHKHNIVITAYSPLGTGRLVNDRYLSEIGKRYGKSASQVSLKWLLDKELVIIPKASTKEHLKEDIDLFDWELSEEDKNKISRKAQSIIGKVMHM
jgi:2,5-diketo-D-gluconate reductase B